MKKRISFNKLLYNDKLMIVLSVIVAVGIWAGVLSSSSNIEERAIPVTVTVDLTNSYAYQSGLRVMGDTTFEVDVNVSGSWSVITKLTENDLRVRPDLTVITGAGDIAVPLTVSRNSSISDYEITSMSPSSVTINCDYWMEGASFRVETDVSALTVADEAYQIGRPVMDTTAFPDGYITVNGPKSTVEKIDSIVARVTTEEVISENAQYSVPLMALDANGNPLDITYCEFAELPEGFVSMTVPIWEERIIDIGYSVINVPAGIDVNEMLITEPATLDLLGPTAELDVLEAQLKNLGEIDFSMLSLTKDMVEFPLAIPSTVVMVNEADAVTVSLKRDDLAQKSLALTATSQNVTVKGSAGKYLVTIPQQSLGNILVVGKKDSITSMTMAGLAIEVDIGTSPVEGTKQYQATIRIKGYDDVWICQDTTVTMFVTLTDPESAAATASEKNKD